LDRQVDDILFFDVANLPPEEKLFTLPQIGAGPFQIIELHPIENVCYCDSADNHLPLCGVNRIRKLNGCSLLLTVRTANGLTRILPDSLFSLAPQLPLFP
jgi:hypothetical protein